MPTRTKATEAEVAARKDETLVKYWMGEIENALKREKKYRESGQKCVDLYEAKHPELTPFNIIYSNTETLAPALYNARPIPIVTRRFKDVDPVGKAVAETSTRVLKYLIDTEDKDYDTFDELTQAAVLDAIVTNRGLTRFKYVAHDEEAYSECVYGEAVRWDKFFHGYARTWKKVPWIGFEWDMSKEELKKNFKGKKLDFRNMQVSTAEDDPENRAEDRDELAGVKTYKVYEIWDKESGKVMFFSGCSMKEPLRVVDDPLGLTNFFPIPKPINLMRKITTLVPTPLYEQYRSQAAELNELTRRLKAIIKAVRFRGMYNSAIEGIDKMLKADDNDFIPVENMQSMPDNTGMDKIIWTVPVNELAQTAQSLYQQRESCKQVIYEITGISDILRGASVASETATAQNIKNQWGTLRLKKMQKEVQRYCRDALAIALEIAAAKFEVPTLKAMTGLPFLTMAEKQQVQQQIQMQQMQAQAVQQPPMPGQPGPPQPPQPPEIPPQLKLALASPTWEEIDQVLKSNIIRHYKTDIETNSTIDAEAAQDKQDIADLLNALGQFMNSIGPLVENGSMPFDIAREMLLVISRRYNFGTNLEEGIQAMTGPQQKEDPKAAADAQKAQGELQLQQMDIKRKEQETQQEMALSQQEFQQKQALAATQLQIEQAELEIKREELAMQKEQMAMKMQLARETHAMKLEQMRTQAALKPKEPVNAGV